MSFYLSLMLFCMATSITPGPNNIMLLMSALNFGVRKTVPHFIGICIGFTIMILSIGFGLNFIFMAYPSMHTVIKVIGIIYMLWLAWQIIMSSPNNKDKNKPLTCIQAIAFQWVNPKVWIMITGVLSAYILPDNNIHIQIVIIAFIYLVVAIPCVGVWMIMGAAFKKILTNAKHLHIFNLICGALIIVSIVIMIVD